MNDTFFQVADNGDFYLTSHAIAVAAGVPERDVAEAMYTAVENGVNTISIPEAWMQSAARRIREAFAATGTDDLATALHYLTDGAA